MTRVTETDITLALDLLYPNECWEITLGDSLPKVRAKMRAVLEGFAARIDLGLKSDRHVESATL